MKKQQQIAVYESDNTCKGPTITNILVSEELYWRGVMIKMQKIGKYIDTNTFNLAWSEKMVNTLLSQSWIPTIILVQQLALKITIPLFFIGDIQDMLWMQHTVWPQPIWKKVRTWWQILPQHQSTYLGGPESASIKIPLFRPHIIKFQK